MSKQTEDTCDEEFFTRITVDNGATTIDKKNDKRALSDKEYIHIKPCFDQKDITGGEKTAKEDQTSLLKENDPTANEDSFIEHQENSFVNDVFIGDVLVSSSPTQAADIKLVDRRTGKEIKTLVPVSDLNICDGVVITVRNKELPEWQSEIKKAKKLTSEQSNNLKAFVAEYGQERPLTRREIATFIEEIRKPKKSERIRQSGHLVDQKLCFGKSKSPQSNIFDSLSPRAQEEIKQYALTIQGIHLTPPQDKLINALNKILHDKSEVTDYKSPAFYLGNEEPAKTPYGQTKNNDPLSALGAVIRFTPHELYSAYIGHKDYSGADISFIKEILSQICDKRFLMTYDRHRVLPSQKKGGKEERLIDKIVEFQPLVKMIQFYEGLSEQENKRINDGLECDKKGEIILALNPIFTDQIDTKYIEYPADINRRMIIAAGGHKRVTQSMALLRDLLLRALSNKKKTLQINESNLHSSLNLDKYVKQGRKKVLKERVEKDIQAMINLGLVLKAELQIGSKGQAKYVFELNKDYDKSN